MNLELFAEHRRFEITQTDWHQAREAAKKAGWKPRGTIIPDDRSWGGSYGRPACQYIAAGDHAGLAEALEAVSDPSRTVILLVGFLTRAAGQKIWIY